MSRFQIGATPTTASAVSTPADEFPPKSAPAQRYSSDNYDDDDLSTLPYPTELPRSDFLDPQFDAQTYLSSLRNRHQTLEDLRSDLRSRSQLLNKELLDLVNGNYEEFLSLGSDLKGGEEQVEGVRVGVLGFSREVEGIKKGVQDRKEEVKALLDEKKSIRREVVVGRLLLEVNERASELEAGLGVNVDAEDEEELDDEDDEDEDDDAATGGPQLRRLQNHTQQFLMVERMIDRIGPDHPFLVAQSGRLAEIKKTMLLDLAAALRQAKVDKAAERTLAIIKLYSDLGAEAESVKVLKAS
ncbi:hypothetical protein Slin15195_G043780 [Septoria linicola]|uniref:Conserved oligomeric Golgi complex subunit 2 n=1 Tax=Septoria linicola TaxID=215465 RepID=A0A9Q9EIF9_9PEZI|nr:hypothetical protein Slin14017_G047300 [Septoria linicola]USW51059.1 hypothetical protein Slin15195_G043780 [Septoria linicola]